MGSRDRSPESDHYALLGVRRDAGSEAIRAAFRAQARRWHPDFNPGDRSAEARMQALNVAFETLSCPLRRREYDRALAAAGVAAGAAPTARRPGRARPMTATERADAWARARAARARHEAQSARRQPRAAVGPDTLGPALTALTVGLITLALFFHALPGPRPQPRLLAEALGLRQPRDSPLARPMVVAPPATEPVRRVVIDRPASRAALGPEAPVPPASAPGADGAGGDPAASPQSGRATLAELVEAARRGEAAAMAWQPRLAEVPPAAELERRERAAVATLGDAAQAQAAWRAAALADEEARRLLLDAGRERLEAARRLAALDAELEAMRAARRAAEATAAPAAPLPGARPSEAAPTPPRPEAAPERAADRPPAGGRVAAALAGDPLAPAEPPPATAAR